MEHGDPVATRPDRMMGLDKDRPAMSAVSTDTTIVTGQNRPATNLDPARHSRSISDALLVFDGSKADERVASVADGVATVFETHLEAVLTNEIVFPTSGFGELLTPPYEISRLDEAAADRAAKKLTERLERTGHPFDLRRLDALGFELENSVSSLSRCVDLVIAARAEGTVEQRPNFTEAVLFGSGTPMLVCPPSIEWFDPAAPAVIGWKNRPECSRAIAGALPFLQRARDVFLVTVSEYGADEQFHREPAADMARHLARHGIRVEIRHLPKWDHPADALLNETKATGAGLLVTGAYGHSRFSEWLLGGVTRELLKRTDVAALLCH